MKSFDALNGSGESIPFVNMSQNIDISTKMLSYFYSEVLGKSFTEDMRAVLREIVEGTIDDFPNAVNLFKTGFYKDRFVFTSSQLDSIKRVPRIYELTIDLAKGFLMCVLIPMRNLGTRQILKISFSWQSPKPKLLSYLTGRHGLKIPMVAPSDADSYHLEFTIPSEAQCLGIRIPEGSSKLNRNTELSIEGGTAHVYEQYSEPPMSGYAWIELGYRRTNEWWQTNMFLVTSIAVFGFLKFVDVSGQESLVTLLASTSSLLIGLIASRESHNVVRAAYFPYRIIMIILALLFLSTALVSFGSYPNDSIKLTLDFSFCLCLLMLLLLLVRRFVVIIYKYFTRFKWWFKYPTEIDEKAWRWML